MGSLMTNAGPCPLRPKAAVDDVPHEDCGPRSPETPGTASSFEPTLAMPVQARTFTPFRAPSSLQLAPLAQLLNRSFLSETPYGIPRVVNGHYEIAREFCQIVQDWDLDWHFRWKSPIPEEQGRALFISEKVDYCMVVSETQGQLGERSVRQPNFQVPLTA